MKVVRKPIIARSLHNLREQKTHTLFSGYLYLQKLSSQLGRLDDLKPEFISYFKKFFSVKDHPLGTPYIKLFTEQAPSNKNLWLNQNVAGSYAPSSLRIGKAFRQVVNIQGTKYSLPPDHGRRAYEHLLFSMPVSVIDLAIVLYRNFGVNVEAATSMDIVEIFAYEFGYSNQPGGEVNDDFRMLYSLEPAISPNEELFENI
ncbi:MAG TPA: hypothetical protein VK582_21405 [Pyrinomonadaceae bacterium]|nr:hypothetical protein [Pyrinomonadaceae bacterium]